MIPEGIKEGEERRVSIVAHGDIFSLNREAPGFTTSLTQFCPTSWAVATTHVRGWVPSRFSLRILASDFKVDPGCRTLSSLVGRWRHLPSGSAPSRQDAA